MIAGAPTLHEWEVPARVEATAAYLAKRAVETTGGPRFLQARTILKSPTCHGEVSRSLREEHPEAEVEVSDP